MSVCRIHYPSYPISFRHFFSSDLHHRAPSDVRRPLLQQRDDPWGFEPSDEDGEVEEAQTHQSGNAGGARHGGPRRGLVIERSRVGGTRLDSAARKTGASVGGTGGSGGGAGDEGNEVVEAGFCMSAVHVSGHGIVAVRECIVGACMHAGVVVSEQGQVTVCKSEVGMCGFVALALSAAAEVRSASCPRAHTHTHSSLARNV